MALFAVLPGPGTLSGAIADMAQGEPAWLAWLDRHAASVIGQHGSLTTAVLALLTLSFWPRAAAPGWLCGAFAALMLTVAVYCAGRLAVARLWHRTTELDTDASHVIMGVAMAGMLVPGLRTLPAWLWEGVFAAGAAWFGGRLIRTRRRAPATQASPWRCLHAAPHLVECAAMLYMFLLLPAAPARAAASMQRGPGPAMRHAVQDRHGPHHGLRAGLGQVSLPTSDRTTLARCSWLVPVT